MKQKTKDLTICALFTAVLAVCAQLIIPMPSGIAFTMQSFAAALCGYTLGAKKAAATATAYLILGATGAPVFSSFTGGIGVLTGPTGGFLLALPVFCALCGATFYVNQKRYKALLLSAAVIVLHTIGIFWFSCYTGNTIITSIFTASLIYLPKDIISVVAACFVAKRIRNAIN